MGNTDNIEYLQKLTDKLIATEIENNKIKAQVLFNAKIWQHIFDAIQDPIFLTTPDLVITRANLAFSNLLSIKIQDVIGKTCFDVFKCVDTVYCGLDKCVIQQMHENKISVYKNIVYSDVFKKTYDLRVYYINKDINSYVHVLREISKEPILCH